MDFNANNSLRKTTKKSLKMTRSYLTTLVYTLKLTLTLDKIPQIMVEGFKTI